MIAVTSKLKLEITENPEVWAWSCTLKGGYSFETHCWAGHSHCWGMFLLTDVNGRMESSFGNPSVACLKLWSRGLMPFASNGWLVLAGPLKKFQWWHLAKLTCNWNQLMEWACLNLTSQLTYSRTQTSWQNSWCISASTHSTFWQLLWETQPTTCLVTGACIDHTTYGNIQS
jgi:hypothetical protein